MQISGAQRSFLWVCICVLVGLRSTVSQSQTAARISQPIDNRRTVKLQFSMHPMVRKLNDGGRLDANFPMTRMLLVLKRSQPQETALRKLVNDLHDPQSVHYQQWLQPEEFGAAFGPADSDIAQVTSWLQQQGFQVNAVGRGKQFIEFSGTAGQVENAFRTEMHRYLLQGAEHIANSSDISLPEALTPVVSGVLSLHNFPKKSARTPLFRVHRDSVTGALQPDLTVSTQLGALHFMTPGDFHHIYNTQPLLNQKINGAGVSIAIVGRSNIDLSDLQTFRRIFGLPARDPIFIVNGQDPGVIPGEDVEAALDLEWSGAAAPNATIKFVLSSSTVTTDGVDLSITYIVDNLVAPIMSTSFSACEAFLGPAGNAFFNNIYEQAAAEGITAFVSTGDNGPAACSFTENNAPAELAGVSGLASTPFNTAVGGTQFSEKGLDAIFWSANNRPDLSSANGYVPERVWNESCDPTKDSTQCGGTGAFFIVAGSGGPSGCIQSTIVGNSIICQGGYPKPSWQAGAGVPGVGARDIPDFSLDAGGAHDGYLLCVEGSCQTRTSNGQTVLENAAVVGGTSASTPAMAGIMALVEQKNGKFQGLANFNFYKLAAKDTLSSCNSTQLTDPGTPDNCFFRDVTSGNNTVPDVNGFPARAGYDLSTGLGTVNAARLVNGWSTSDKLASRTTLAPGAVSMQHGQPFPIRVTVSPKAGTGSPSGDFDLISDTQQSVLGGALTNGAFSGAVSDLPGGEYNIHARYSGDAMFLSSTSGSVPVSISAEKSVIDVSAWEINLGGFLHSVFGPLLYGQPAALQVKVAGVSGHGAATGKVTVSDGGRRLGTFPLAKGGAAFIEVDNLPAATGMTVGSHSFTVSYSGDNSFRPAVSSVINLRVIRKTPITIITPVPGDVSVGAPLELVLLVGGAGLALVPGVELPTGTVRVFDGDQAISGPIPLMFNGPEGPGASQAIFSTSKLAEGFHGLTLHYSGDANYNPVTSSPFAFGAGVNVNPTQGTIPLISLQQLPPQISLGQSVSYAVSVRAPGTGGAVPTGKVSLVASNGAAFAGPVSLAGGNASLLLSFAAAGRFELAVTYSGDSRYSPYSSSVIHTNVNPGTPVVGLKPAAGRILAGTQTSLTASVTGAPVDPILSGTGAENPTGTVQFFDSVNGATAQPLAAPQFLTAASNRQPIYTLPIILPPGSNVLTVQYSGDRNWKAATSAPVTVTVQ